MVGSRIKEEEKRPPKRNFSQNKQEKSKKKQPEKAKRKEKNMPMP